MKKRIQKKRVMSDVKPLGNREEPLSKILPREQIISPKDVDHKGDPKPNIYKTRPRKTTVPKNVTVSENKYPQSEQTPRSSKKTARTVSILVGTVLVLFGGVYIFSSLAITVTPKKTVFQISDPLSLTLGGDEFSISETASQEAQTTQEQNFTNKARGTIVVFNDFSSASQVLVGNTRFESPDGFIYRTTERIVVPGKKGEKPGTIEVEVVADKPGDTYNIGLTDFTIPGFAGTDRFRGFFGRSKTEMAGGREGFGKVVGEAESEQLLAGLEGSLRGTLVGSLERLIPDEFLILEDQIFIDIDSRKTNPGVGSPADTYIGEVGGSARTLAVNRQVFSDMLARELFGEQYEEGLYKVNFETSDIRFTASSVNFEGQIVTLNLAGSVVYRWGVDEEALRTRVMNAKNKAELARIYREFPGIAKTQEVFSPGAPKFLPWRDGQLKIMIGE